MKIRELQSILDAQPSVSRSTFLVGTLYVLCGALAIVFLILGIGLLLESFLHFKIILGWLSRNTGFLQNGGQGRNIATTFGVVALIISVIFVGMMVICRMVLRRNHFILTVEDWIYQNIKDVNRPPAQRSRQ